MATNIKRKPVNKEANNEGGSSSVYPRTYNVLDQFSTVFQNDDLDFSLRSITPLATENEPFLSSSSSSSSTLRIQKSILPNLKPSEGTCSNNQVKNPTPTLVKHIDWGIDWQKPTLICFMLLGSLILSLGHHFYYLSLNNTPAGDASRQAWAIRFGTAFAFFVTSCLKAVTTTAFGQYLWTIVKRTPLTIGSLDKLHALMSDPAGIFSLELFKTTRIALGFGCIYWCLGFAGIAPPATLIVIAQNITVETSVPVLDFGLSAWNNYWENEEGSILTRIASQSASSFEVVPITIPAAGLDYSYDLQFFGPSVECNLANSTEQLLFDKITSQFEAQDSMFIFSQVNDNFWNNSLQTSALFHSAWYVVGLTINDNAMPPDYWVPTNCSGYDKCFGSDKILVQTSTSSIVCTLRNASFDITIDSINGLQQITQRDIHVVNTNLGTNIEYQYLDSLEAIPFLSYLDVLGSLLAGNMSLVVGISVSQNSQAFYPFSSINTELLSTGLVACDDIQQSPFVAMLEAPGNFTNGLNSTIPSELWMCRNRTYLRAIEDLANNITISFLSSSDLTNSNTTFRNITTSNTRNIYAYHPLYLFLSYGIALLFTSLTAAIGLYSIHVNGVSHSTSFSAQIAASRNPELDELMEGASLAADPMSITIKKRRMRFGPLLNKDREMRYKGGKEGVEHIAFGFEDSIGRLRKGGKYI